MANYEAIQRPVSELRLDELTEANAALIVAERTIAAAAGGILALHQNQAPNTQAEV